MSSGEPWVGARVAVLAVGAAALGGADRFYEAIVEALGQLGCRAEIFRLPGSERNFEDILANYRHCRALDLSHFDVVISSKAPGYAVRHPRHVIYLMHTVRAFDDMFDAIFPAKDAAHFEQRKQLHDLDFAAFSSARTIYCNGGEVRGRLARKFGLDATVLHPPLAGLHFRNDGDDGTFLLPGRLHRWKRVDLAIAAAKRLPDDTRLLIAGEGEDEGRLKALAGGDERIVFLGAVPDEQLVSLYARCRAAIFVPVREDYGYVTLEAFASGKPVITCRDSGEVTHFVRSGRTGLVTEPEATALAAAMQQLADDPAFAARMGAEGKAIASGLSWRRTCVTLLRAAYGLADTAPKAEPKRACILDMQPIEPPVGGGRLRLLGLYHDLGAGFAATYVGSYDWPGERRRVVAHPPGLAEITVPLSDAHHREAAAHAAAAGGKGVIDIGFSELAHLSPEFLSEARAQAAAADVVVFSHPWVHPLVRDALGPDQVVVYDAHNVEAYLRRQLLDVARPFEKRLLEGVVRDEYRLVREADLVLACSLEDAQRFNRIYDVPFERMRVVPNGVMAGTRRPPDAAARATARRALRLEGRLCAIFLGSAYGPNVEAARFICDAVAPRVRDITFVIAGGVGAEIATTGSNVRVTGALSGEELDRFLAAADIALNPMLSGSGTNIKMFDFMAVGLPVVTTATGARGIETGRERAFLIVSPDGAQVATALAALSDSDLRSAMGAAGRRVVERTYSWEQISRNVGRLLEREQNAHRHGRPLYSVIVPSYERPDQLGRLLERLAEQVEVDFEVIVVDQSEVRFAGAERAYGFPLHYVHSSIRGSTHARNLGAFLARGRLLAFTDDDCLPEPAWLLNARRYFADADVVAVEGRIHSDHIGEADWRPVTNVGFEGIGFMTANMIVRQEAFQRIGGFDPQFDDPGFREDTDLGWRLQALGRVPYGNDVPVFHPAQPRSVARESLSTRLTYFSNDALLQAKHPEKFRILFERENHIEKTPEYAGVLRNALAAYGVTAPDWLRERLDRAGAGR